MKKFTFCFYSIVLIFLLSGCASSKWPIWGGDTQITNSAQKKSPSNPRLVERDLSGATLAPVQVYLSTGLRTDIQTEIPEEGAEKSGSN